MARVAASTSPPAVEVAVAPPPVWHSLAAGGASAIVSRLVTCELHEGARSHRDSDRAAQLAAVKGRRMVSHHRLHSAGKVRCVPACLRACLPACLPHSPLATVPPSCPFPSDPPDTVKSRLQVQGSGGCAALYTGTGHAFAKIAAQEVGWAGGMGTGGCGGMHAAGGFSPGGGCCAAGPTPKRLRSRAQVGVTADSPLHRHHAAVLGLALASGAGVAALCSPVCVCACAMVQRASTPCHGRRACAAFTAALAASCSPSSQQT
jgi:hypothetical protein